MIKESAWYKVKEIIKITSEHFWGFDWCTLYNQSRITGYTARPHEMSSWNLFKRFMTAVLLYRCSSHEESCSDVHSLKRVEHENISKYSCGEWSFFHNSYRDCKGKIKGGIGWNRRISGVERYK